MQLLQRLKHRIKIRQKKRLDSQVCAITNLVPNTETVEEDVFIVGHPKSGNTWFQSLIAGAIYGIDLGSAPYSFVWDLVPDHAWPYFKRYNTPTYFKSHSFPRPHFRRVVYLLRDGRDVMVSYFHFLSEVRRQRGQATDLLGVVSGQQGYYENKKKWHEHVESWLANPYNADMLIIRYEDLKSNTVRELRRFCDFVGAQRDDTRIKWAAQQATFERMQSKELSEGLRKPQWGRDKPNWPGDRPFMRRGEVGSHKDELPADVLSVFLSDAKKTLQKLGYLPNRESGNKELMLS